MFLGACASEDPASEPVTDPRVVDFHESTVFADMHAQVTWRTTGTNRLYRMYEDGLRLIQLIHFRNNELGHMQTWPYSPGGLTAFGRDVVREANRLGLIIDMAHANHETMMDILQLSEHPVIFSHGGVRALTDHDRAVTDDEIRAIAAKGGVVGIWPHGRHISDVAEMGDYIEHVIEVGGIDHVGIGSDLRGISRYVTGFGDQAKFHAVATEFLNRDYSAADVGKVMGGNFFRVWQAVIAGRGSGQG